MYCIEIRKKPRVPDAEGDDTLHGIADLRVHASSVRIDQVYLLEGVLSKPQLRNVAEKVLVDPIIEDYSIVRLARLAPQKKFRDSEKADWSVLKTFHHGVTDNAGQTTLEAVRNLGLKGVEAVMTAKRYRIAGSLTFAAVRTVATRLLANPLIESVLIERLKDPS